MNKNLLLKYFIIYPLYYVIAMLFAVIILTFLMGWNFSFFKKIFLMFACIMWFVCYFTHLDIFRYAIGSDAKTKRK